MAKFLNTQLLSEWIFRLIEEAEREIVLLVPYIQLSNRLIQALSDADQRGVETLLIYREAKLSDREREKLLSISNLNLMHHPNLHAKCYMSEDYLIIGSMNLYEYSEKNNREMGVLLHRHIIEKVEPKPGSLYTGDRDSRNIFDDAIQEIKLIVNSAKMERPSTETTEEGFELDIIKTPKDNSLDRCKRLNNLFLTKTFHTVLIDGKYYEQCDNFYDRIDLIYVENGFRFNFNYPQARVDQLFKKIRSEYDEDSIPDFKLFDSTKYKSISLYRAYSSAFWDEVEIKEGYKKQKWGVEKVIQIVREFI